MVRSKDLNHPVGYAATPVLTRLYGRETRPHRVAPGRGIFREASLGGMFWEASLEGNFPGSLLGGDF
jgi:hypothetical protein